MSLPSSRLLFRRHMVGFAVLTLLVYLAPASVGWAAPATCQAGGEGAYCVSSADCAGNSLATACVSGHCEIPCQDSGGRRLPTACSLGETCIAGETEALPVWYCKPSTFAMDLNLLDSCVGHFIDGLRPDLTSVNACSLENNLSHMLDQDGNGVFNIFDVDGCIRAFLNQEACSGGTCAGGGVYCDGDDACGQGLYCNTRMKRCERECGLIASREDVGVSVLERKCTSALTVCDYDHGRCVASTNLSGTTCQVDADCPRGAVCSMGTCAAKCQRSTDCPDSTWYCGTSNRCLPRPTASGPAGFTFDPLRYSVRVAAKTVTLTAVEDKAQIPLLIMDLVSKKQVFDNPAVVFGYRLEAAYQMKQDEKCLANPIAEADTADCTIRPDQQFITLGNPFGVVSAQGAPAISILLDNTAAQKLSTGLYLATISIFLSNGGQDSFTVQYRKTSPSGLYAGSLSIYHTKPANLLGKTNVTMKLFVDPKVTKTWDSMIAEQGLATSAILRDITKGDFVTGYIDGNDSMVFDQPNARTKSENKIPVRGLYSREYGRLHLVAAVDIPADFCRSDAGDCAKAPMQTEVRATNPFGRPIRRIMHFFGPFDLKTFSFQGLYREVLYGLAPETRTLEGEFQLDQWKSDESPVCDTPASGNTSGCRIAPLYASQPPRADFPPSTTIQDRAQADVDAYCGAAKATELATYLKGKGAFANYLAQFCDGANGDYCTDYCPDADSKGKCSTYPQLARRARAFTNMLRIEGEAMKAVDKLSKPAASSALLTLNDFFRGQIVFCGDGIAADKPCIDRNQALCGMALYRRSLLNGDISLSVPPRYLNGTTTNEPESEILFCSEGGAEKPDPRCRLNGALYPSTVALQEYNRFYKQFADTTRYQAANDLSDAFYAMYRAANGSLERAKVLSEKQSKLQSALANLDSFAVQAFSSVSSQLLFNWPMGRFNSHGSALLQQLHSVLKDRLDVVSSLIDLKRRVLASSSDADFTFVQHLMHLEYLNQAYLMFLQEAWEKDAFSYAGQGPEALKTGQAIVSRVTGDRNPLGLFPQQIYFENANLSTSNWKNYRAQIIGGAQGAGLLADVKDAVQKAVTNIKASLQDQKAFTDQLLAARQQFEQTIDNFCGAPDAAPASTKDCELQTDAERQLAMSCTGPSCLSEYQCTDPACSKLQKVFKTATGEALQGTACDLNIAPVSISRGSTTRLCMRGQMGDLLRQREQLHMQRKQIVGKINALVRQIASQAKLIKESQSENAALNAFISSNFAATEAVSDDISMAESIFNAISTNADTLDCLVIIGLAAGTDCVGKAAKNIIISEAAIVRDGVLRTLTAAKDNLALQKELRMLESQQGSELRRQRMELDNLTTNVENYIAEYETTTNALFSINAKIEDTRYLAEQAAKRADETVTNIIDHLLGGMNGDVLLRNKYVLSSDAKFQDLLLATYKMSMAFIHSYNLKSQSQAITSRVFQLMTFDDVDDFLKELDRYEAEYCGGAGIDCDSVNNVETFRFSVRDQLFPSLRDIVDSRTGAVLTKGEQFHNIITSGSYLHTRERAGQLVKQIEIPFAIWLNDRGKNGAYVQQWMVSPLECNHIIAAGTSGTIAVNVIGTRLRNLTYELGRGNTDYIRSCDPAQAVSRDGSITKEFPINSFLVGYAPQNSLAQSQNTPAYVTHSNGLLACKNVPELNGNSISNESCFKYFARERSLGAPDWTLTIPFGVAYDNDWLFGADNPIIEDIVIYIRYRTRPI
jgi:hypothetical protein